MSIVIHPKGSGHYSDVHEAEQLAASAPTAFRIAQDVLVAADHYLNRQGHDSENLHRLYRELQSKVSQLSLALEFDKFMTGQWIAGDKLSVFFEFFTRISNAFPNWQDEYALLNELLPQWFAAD